MKLFSRLEKLTPGESIDLTVNGDDTEWQDLEGVGRGIVKDIKDTFKPYKSKAQILKDTLYKPWYGIKNIARGIFIGICGGFLAAVGSVGIVVCSPFLLASEKTRTTALGYSHYFLQNWLGKGMLSLVIYLPIFILRGITQIAFYPLTLLRSGLRGILTAILGKPAIENNPGFRKLALKKYSASELHDEKAQIIAMTLILKVRKALRKGQFPSQSQDEQAIEQQLSGKEAAAQITPGRSNTAIFGGGAKNIIPVNRYTDPSVIIRFFQNNALKHDLLKYNKPPTLHS